MSEAGGVSGRHGGQDWWVLARATKFFGVRLLPRILHRDGGG